LVALADHTPYQVLNGTAARVEHYNPESRLRLVLAIKPPHMAEEEQFLKELVTKGSPNFHKFLTAEEWNARFAPSAEDEQKVVDWAESQGLSVTNRYPNRLLVDLEAPAGVIEKAFGVTINNYRVDDEVDFANDRDPILPASLSGIVYNVEGLNNIQRDHGSSRGSEKIKGPDYAPGPVARLGGSAHGGPDPSQGPTNLMENDGPVSNITNGEMDPSDLYSSQTYDYNGLQRFSHCCNVPGDSSSPPESSIAIAGFGEFMESDISGFASAYGLWFYNTYYYVDGTSSFCNTGQSPPCATGETTEDIEWSTAAANSSNNPYSTSSEYNTAQEFIYLGVNGNNGTYTDIYNKMLTDGHARVMSTSWSCTEIYGCATATMDARHAIFASMVGQGWTLIAASGDRGATDDCNTAHIAVAYPASDPLVVAAGGTQLSLNSNGTWNAEQGWQGGQFSGACGQNDGGSGGGISAYYARPGYQSPQSSLGSNRLTPDISLNALGIGQNLYINGSMSGDGNGTSVVAPELAGFFAQENSYLDYIDSTAGNICGSGTTACSPIGDPHAWIYFVGNQGAPHNPYYDITTGCNSNNITTAGGLPYYCAGAGYDLVTGWGAANMMQLAWGINWQMIPAYGKPSITFASGPDTDVWYNTDQEVSWKVTDGVSQGSSIPTGVAGFTQGWDSIPADPGSEPHGGSGNSFYSGPEYPFGKTGCLSFNGLGGCAGGPQGCHTVNVEAWDNQGSTATGTYGPVCVDTVAPTVTVTNSPSNASTNWVNQSVTVTLTPVDPGGSNASGIYFTAYDVENPESNCYPGFYGTGCYSYGGPITISTQGATYIYYFAKDNAGNYSTETYEYVYIDTTPPVTTSGLSGTIYSGSIYDTAVQVSLNATDNLSGVAHTYYQIDGGSTAPYGGAFNVSTLGAHNVKYWSVDNAGNTETAHSISFSIVSPTTAAVVASPNPSFVGESVKLTGTVTANVSGTPTGSVTFWNGATNLGTGTLNGSGVASINTTALPAGALTLQISYPGAGNFLATNSPPFDQTVTGPALLSSPTQGATLTGLSESFSWNAPAGATAYQLWVGSTGVNSNNLYSSGVITSTSTTVTKLPLNGATVYGRLYTEINGIWLHQDYTFTAAAPATLTTPTQQSTLPGPYTTFTWTTPAGAAGYQLWLGTTGVNSQNLFSSGIMYVNTTLRTNMPTNGETVYARLYSDYGGTWVHSDYTFTAANQAAPVSPAASGTLAGPTETFTWTAATGSSANAYQLWLGTTGVASQNVYSSGVIFTTSVTRTNMPTNGETLYARLYTDYDGVWVHEDYTLTAAAAAVLISPAPSGTLTGSSEPFTWSAGTGASDYQLWIGSTGVGSQNLYSSGAITATTVTPTGLPTTGATLNVRLYTELGGVWVHTDYTVTAQ